MDPAAKSLAVKYLSLNFEGYFMCRIATDPDPTDEAHGTSGYTMALHGEPSLDQVIRIQPGDDNETALREPAEQLGIRIGVCVGGVNYDGQFDEEATKLLRGATVNLCGRDDTFDGPTFVSRNNTVGSDDTMAFVVEPFDLWIEHEAVTIRATDDLDPENRDKLSWQIDQPKDYARRLPTRFVLGGSAEAHQAIGVYDEYGYYRDRRRWLNEQIECVQKKLGENNGNDADQLKAELEGYRSRLFQLETWGDRVINKLGFLCEWDFLINGKQSIEGHDALQKALPDGCSVDCGQRWPVRFWFGGWDGDLLTGYMRGTLDLPLTRRGSSG